MNVERPFTPVSSSEPADWLVERLTDFDFNVSSVIPSGFEAYARVFHPAEKVTYTSPDWAQWRIEPIRWTEVATLTGRTAHRTMQWASLNNENLVIDDEFTLEVGDVWVRGPEEGSLSVELAQTLWRSLAPCTTTPDTCFFAIWEGFGGLPKFIHEAPAFEIPARRFYLFRAPLQTVEQSFYTGATYDDMGEGFTVLTLDDEKPLSPEEMQEMLRALPEPEMPIQSANLWWPSDRAWCVATEIDLNTTYVAGTQALIDTLLTHPNLETYQVELTDKITYDSDTLNPLPSDPYGNSFKI